MFSPKDPSETVTITFDFSALTPQVSNPTINVTVVEGTDPSPNSIKLGGPVATGANVLQQVNAGVSGVTYRFKCDADGAGGNRYTLSELMLVTPVKP